MQSMDAIANDGQARCRLARLDADGAASALAQLTPGADALVLVAHSALQLQVTGFAPLAVNPNGVLLLDPGDRIALVGDAPGRCRGDLLRLPPALAERLARLTGVYGSARAGARLFPFPWCRTSPEAFLALRRIAREAGDSVHAAHAAECWLQGLLQLAPGEWRRRGVLPRPPEAMADTRGFGMAQAIAMHLDACWRSGSSLDALGARFGLSPFHLLRAFRRAIGLTPHQYVLQLRLRRSLQRLDAGEERLADLARDLGFSSHGHYSTAFRASFGLTPAQYAGPRRGPRALRAAS